MLVLLTIKVTAQRHSQGIGLHFGGYDFYGPQSGQYFYADQYRYTYSDTKSGYDTSLKKTLYWRPLVQLSYWWALSRSFDIKSALSLANLEYPASSDDTVFKNKYYYNLGGQRREKFLGELDVRVNWNILPRTPHDISPYLTAGLTLSYHDIFWGADIPVGLGFNIRLDDHLYLNLESMYKVAVTSNDYNHLQHTVGVVYWFKPGYKAPAVLTLADVLPPPDMDKDGVTDSVDKCPTIPGLSEFDGCPDSDNDGIADNEDECPLVTGLKQFNGCPDSDNDGIPDNKDKCPYVAGPVTNNGCPADRDHDGVNDDVDKCPDVAGLASNQGCPEIRKEIIQTVEKAARSVYFETGKSTLKKVSYISLNKIAQVMKDDPTLNVDISGHTDNVGNGAYNLELSDKRANVCREYLIGQGISADRITAKGFGMTMPIADNKTALGRAQNRRTEFKLRNYK